MLVNSDTQSIYWTPVGQSQGKWIEKERYEKLMKQWVIRCGDLFDPTTNYKYQSKCLDEAYEEIL